MLAFGRLERLGRRGDGIAGRLERFGVGQVRHEARVEHVADRRVAAEVLVAFGVGGIALVEERGTGVDPVFTTAEGQAPLAEGHLVLDVQAGLLGLLFVVIEGCGACRTLDRQAIDRVVDVDARRGAEDREVVGGVALVVQADQQGVTDVAGDEVALEVVVHGELGDVFVDIGGATAGVALIVDDRPVRGAVAIDGHGLERQLRLGVAQVLAELPDIVQAVFEGITQCVVGAVVEVVVRVTQVLVVGDIAERHVDLGALDRIELTGDTGIVTGELREQGEFGVFVDVPGQAGRNVVALVIDVVDGGAAVAQDAAEAVKELAFVIDLAGAGEVDLAMIVAAVLQLDLAAGFSAWATADHVQQAARRGLAVHGGGRAAQQRQAVEVPGFLFRVGVHTFWQWQAVEELSRLETAHAQPVGAGVAAEAAGGDARQVAHGIVEGVRVAVVHLLASDDRNRTRCLDQRGVGLGAGGGALGQVALYRAPGAFSVLHADHAGGRQVHHTLGHGHQAIGARTALFQLQPGATQGFAQGAGCVELAFDRRRGLARRQGWIQRQGQTGLAGNLVQGVDQWSGRQVVGADAGRLFSGDQLAAGQRGAKGNGNRQQTAA
ncbi:hypothetical protein D3C84_515340 [compost metagenome]